MENRCYINGDVCTMECKYKGDIVQVMFSTCDLERVKEMPANWQVKAEKNGILRCSTKFINTTIALPRWILEPPDNMVISFINGNALDVTRSNMEVLTRANMGRKLRRNNTSGTPGVCWNPTLERWVARIQINHEMIWLGAYKDKEEAVAMRMEAEENV